VTDYFVGTGWSFGLEISGMAFTEINKIDGVKLEADVIELKTQSLLGAYTRKKLPGRMKSGTLTITRSVPIVGTTYEFTEWIQKVFAGDMSVARRQAIVRVYQVAGPTFTAGLSIGTGPEVMKFIAYNCWPTAIEYGSFQAGNTGTLDEKVTIHHEGLYAVPPMSDPPQPLF